MADVGTVEVQMPHDRNASFAPVTAPKHTRRLDGPPNQVVPRYARGTAPSEIQAQLEGIYGTELSRETIPKITDQVVADTVAWQQPSVRSCVRCGADRRNRDQGP